MTPPTPRGSGGLRFPRPALSSSVVGSPGISLYLFLAAWRYFGKFPIWPATGWSNRTCEGRCPFEPRTQIQNKEVFPMAKGKRTRPYGLSIRMTAEERKAVQKRIKESGRSQRDFVLHALLSIPIINNYGLQSLLPEIRRIGNNLNQMARSCNQGKHPAYVEIVAMRKELSQLWQSLRQLNQEHL